MQPTLAPTTNVPSIDGAVVEGLFVRALKASGPFADALRAVGVDVKRLEPKYSFDVYRAALRVAHQHVCPSLTESEGQRELGRRFTAGFLDTILGAVMGSAMSVLGPAAFVKRLPRTMSLGRKEINAEAIEEGDRRWRIRSRNPVSVPHFIAGSVEAMMRRLRVEPTIEVESTRPDGFDLTIRW